MSEEWECGIIGYIDEIQGRLDVLETALSNYIEAMRSYISPESEGLMMRVDRNDIWYNIQQIAQQYEQFLTIQGDAGSSYPDYRHFAIGLSAEEELLMREQEERERERRERNYQKLVSFRQGSVNNALNYFLENMGDINAIYKNAIIPFENTDDDYASLAEFYYDMWATTEDNWTDFLRSSGDICRGLWDAVVDLLDGIASLGAFAIYESLPASCYANGDIALLPDCITERALGTYAAIEMLIKEPGIVVDCMGQNMMDTYEEESLAYAIGYITLDVAIEILTTKGAGSVKGALRTTDATSDVMNTVTTTERVADDILDVAEGAKNTGRAAENVTDVAEEGSKIQEILRNKRVSDAYPELDELEKFYDDIYEQQRNICQEYEDYLDELRKLQSEPDIVPEGSADVVEEVAESVLEGGSDTVAYHSVGGENSAKKIQSVLDGIDISYTSPESRFGQGFYVAADGNTTVAELAYHGTDAKYSIRYDMNLEGQKVLDLTDPKIASEWGFLKGESSLLECQNIAEIALDEGYNVIKVHSYRDAGINYVIYDNFDEILQPQMVTPIGD